MSTAPTPPHMTYEEIEDHAGELLRALTPHAGNPEALTATFMHWLDRLDVPAMSRVCMKALHLVFRDCLTPVPRDQAPPGALSLTAPTEENAA